MTRATAHLLAAAAGLSLAAAPLLADSCYDFQITWGRFGSAHGEMSWPQGLEVDGSGNVYVTDRGDSRVQKFTGDGQFLVQYGGHISGIESPIDVGVTAAGQLYVLDRQLCEVVVYAPGGAELFRFGGPGNGDGQMSDPRSIALDEAGNVYVSDSGNHRIQKFDAYGIFLARFGGPGSGDGQFLFPVGIEVDGGFLYVVDQGNARIQKLTTGGGFVAAWGSSATLGIPVYIAADPSGNLLVTDQLGQVVRRCSPTGVPLCGFGAPGEDAGEFTGPTGIAVDAGGRVFVSEPGDYLDIGGNHRVQRFGPSPSTAARRSTWGGVKAIYR